MLRLIKKKRKWRDSNPRMAVKPPPVFKTGAIVRSATLPCIMYNYTIYLKVPEYYIMSILKKSYKFRIYPTDMLSYRVQSYQESKQ